ncbi:dnaJ homolog subfamily C member 2-like [Artemia franciscana]
MFEEILIEPVGPAFLKYWKHYNCTGTLDEKFSSLTISQKPDESDEIDELEDEEDLSYLHSLDPKEWKDQDHYKVLGLDSKRVSANDEDIKRAYRRKVLKHHPDKRKAKGETVDVSNDYFTCITKAFDILGSSASRRSYDSVDPIFDDDIPSVNQESKDNFFKEFGPVFEANARWSNIQPVPKLGNASTPREEVEHFYDFWYNFDSWREYSYLDEEDKSKGESREERRWIEKQNKVERTRRKKEESARIRSLVDNAYACDPRIAKFREDLRKEKLAKKLAKEEAARAKIEEKQREIEQAKEAERIAKEKAEEEEKKKMAEAKKAKEQHKKKLKKVRADIWALLKEHIQSDDVVGLEKANKIADTLPLERLETLSEELKKINSSEKIWLLLDQEISALEDKAADQKLARSAEATIQTKSQKEEVTTSGELWTYDETTNLIKAVNMFPAGTSQRWEVIANHLETHHKMSRSGKEVLYMAKMLQNHGTQEMLRRAASQQKGVVTKNREATISAEISSAEQREDKQWLPDEQKRLEQALRSFGPNEPERWEKISECVQTRTKKECMIRYKHIVDMVKAKKKAGAQGTGTAKT